MAGPAAGIILPEPLTQVQKNDIFLYLESIASQIHGKYDYSIEGRPFLYTEGPETDDALQNYIDEAVPEVIGWIPQDSIGFAAMCKSEQDHRILGELCLYFARELSGLIDFGWTLGKLTDYCGTLYEIYYDKHNGLNQFYHVGDAEFMEYWLQHPAFHMIK
ncbi:MAG: DUF6368 family protein [Gimesia chilikensis]|uniref:DUF6368 family protein n=1 Tax=Gimesia chilikensis TaxID=2605989 RepID=UPI0037A00E28